MKKLPISAIVTTCNEDSLLEKCLSKLGFCDELLVVDLGSTDRSVEIAKKYADRVIENEAFPFVEKAIEKFAPTLKNDWVLHIDPDELLDEQLVPQIQKELESKRKIATISVPWIFYFKGKILKTTIWGQKRNKRILYNKTRVKFKGVVHEGAEIVQGEDLAIESEHALHHYWMSSYKHLIAKHKRYIKAEGERRYSRGERYSLIKKLKESILALASNLVYHKGVLGGLNGIYLSFFYSWYVFQSNNSLKLYEENKK